MTAQSTKFQIDFQPIGRRAEAVSNVSLLEAAQSAGVELIAVCGGTGTCGTCRMRLMTGTLSAPTPDEEFQLGDADLKAGYRLACQCRPLTDVRVHIPPESLTTPQRTQTEGREIDIEIDPLVRAIDVTMPPPDLYDLRSDATRLIEALGDRAAALDPAALSIDYPALLDLSPQLRAQHWQACVAVRGQHVIGVLPGGAPLAGLAVDVGTTKLAAYLVDLATGRTLARAGAMNPQIAYGEDVISRIAYANHGDEQRATLQRKLVDALNSTLRDLCVEAQIAREQVVEAVIVGNTAMHHLLVGLPVHQLGTAPYVPTVSDALEIRAADIGLELAPGAQVFLPPNIAGFVGADHVSMLLATDVWRTDKTVVALDIGTNTEISVVRGGELVCCSCASGPAFEGAHIHDGMRAAPGAIERVQVADGGVRIHTIGNQPAVGICGSGILDSMAELLKAGILDERGTLKQIDPRVRVRNGKTEFVMVPAPIAGHGRDVVVTRNDVNEIQLAKSAIRVGIDVLLAESGIVYQDIDEFVVAGAFGTYLDIGSAVRIGMFPDLPLSRFQQVGNAAGTGARQMLVSAERRRQAIDVARRDRYIELTTYPEFTSRFVASMYF